MNDEKNNYPPWYRKPEPVIVYQVSLFKPSIKDISAEHKVSLDELFRWYHKGWLSFNPHEKDELNEPDVFEIILIRDVVRSGLSDANIEDLFSQLPKPLSFDPEKIAYSFSLGWVEYDENYNDIDYAEIIGEHLEEWLYEISADGDEEAINNIISMIEKIKDQVND